jgi:hypothetical protein
MIWKPFWSLACQSGKQVFREQLAKPADQPVLLFSGHNGAYGKSDHNFVTTLKAEPSNALSSQLTN